MTVASKRAHSSNSFPESSNALAIMVTRRCNMACGHCSVESAPRIDGRDPTESELLQLLRDAAEAGVNSVQFTGGEPMFRPKLLLRLMREAHRLGMISGIATNGYWGKKPRQARAYLREMLRNGLQFLTISYDRYHAEFMGPEPIYNIAAAAADYDFPVNVNVTRVADDPELDRYAELFGHIPNVRMRFYDVQPLGRARKFGADELRSEVEGFCSAVAQPAVTDDGRVIACNGPAYFQPSSSPLHLGRLAESTFEELARKHWSDPVLATIRTFGPGRLRDELKQMPEFAGYLREGYSGQCDLCLHISANEPAVNALRETLAAPQYAAERQAKWSVMQAARQSGVLNRDYVNGPAASQVMLSAALGLGWPTNTDRILGRADLDWNHLLEYVCACGMAGALVVPCKQEAFTRWAPTFFNQRLQDRATRDALRELSQREALDRVGDVLQQLGAWGILLKGLALRALDLKNGQGGSSRIAGDMDILIEDSGTAEKLRRQLLEHGFTGDANAPRTGPHHLAPIEFLGVPLEIHTGVLPGFWGFPEDETRADLQQVSDKHPLFIHGPEALLLHACIHTTTHLFSHGLKLGFDVERILRAHPEFDWDKLAQLAASTRCPRAFWTPLRALAREIDLGIPKQFLALAPVDSRQRELEVVASKRIFSTLENVDEMNPFTRNGIFLLLFDNTYRRLQYLASLSTGQAAESRKTALAGSGNQARANLPQHLKAALRDWRRFRRATRAI